jgi:hypothetical protein
LTILPAINSAFPSTAYKSSRVAVVREFVDITAVSKQGFLPLALELFYLLPPPD